MFYCFFSLLSNHRKKRCGRPRIPVEDDIRKIRAIDINDRQTYRDIVEKTGISFYRVRRFMKEGVIRRVTSHTKPILTAKHRADRLKYCKSFIDKDTGRFDVFMYQVNIDEKLFNLCKVKSKFYLLPDEDTPLRVALSK